MDNFCLDCREYKGITTCSECDETFCEYCEGLGDGTCAECADEEEDGD